MSSNDRIHLQDPRSKLFYKYVEVLGWTEDVAREMKVLSVLMVENVVGDDEDIKEMSQQLGLCLRELHVLPGCTGVM